MRSNTAFLLRHVARAERALASDLRYTANDGTEDWSVSTQLIERRRTGKIVVNCLDDAVLEELKTELQGHGYAVEDDRHLETGDVVPHTILITPGS